MVLFHPVEVTAILQPPSSWSGKYLPRWASSTEKCSSFPGGTPNNCSRGSRTSLEQLGRRVMGVMFEGEDAEVGGGGWNKLGEKDGIVEICWVRTWNFETGDAGFPHYMVYVRINAASVRQNAKFAYVHWMFQAMLFFWLGDKVPLNQTLEGL